MFPSLFMYVMHMYYICDMYVNADLSRGKQIQEFIYCVTSTHRWIVILSFLKWIDTKITKPPDCSIGENHSSSNQPLFWRGVSLIDHPGFVHRWYDLLATNATNLELQVRHLQEILRRHLVLPVVPKQLLLLGQFCWTLKPIRCWPFSDSSARLFGIYLGYLSDVWVKFGIMPEIWNMSCSSRCQDGVSILVASMILWRRQRSPWSCQLGAGNHMAIGFGCHPNTAINIYLQVIQGSSSTAGWSSSG